MVTFQYDLPLQQGASLDKTLKYSSGDPLTPVDLSACTAWLSIRKNDQRKTEVLRLTTDAGGGLQLGNGTIRVMIQRTQSLKFNWDDASYELWIQYPASADFPDGFVRKFMTGSANPEHSNG